jgi:uncharacterized membrane protein YdbT with pleckstrin-like domain
MGYIGKNLILGEKIICTTRLHWIIFLWPTFFCLIVVMGLIVKAFPLWFYYRPYTYSLLLFIVSSKTFILLNICVVILLGLLQLINLKTSEFGVTNKRVLIKVGFLRRYSIELLLTKVEGIQVAQSILGRILRYGTIIITGTGGGKEPFHKIDDPFEFRRQVQEQIEAVQELKLKQ